MKLNNSFVDFTLPQLLSSNVFDCKLTTFQNSKYAFLLVFDSWISTIPPSMLNSEQLFTFIENCRNFKTEYELFQNLEPFIFTKLSLINPDIILKELKQKWTFALLRTHSHLNKFWLFKCNIEYLFNITNILYIFVYQDLDTFSLIIDEDCYELLDDFDKDAICNLILIHNKKFKIIGIKSVQEIKSNIE